MVRKIGLVHTVAPAVPLFNELSAEIFDEAGIKLGSEEARRPGSVEAENWA